MLCCVGNLTKVLQQTMNICKTFENMAQTWSCLNSMAFVVIHCSTRCNYLCALLLRTNFSGKSRKKSILLKTWEWVIFFTCTTLGPVRICYFWNAFTCPYTLVSAGTVRNGQQVCSELQTYAAFLFPWGSTERIEVIQRALFSWAELWKNTPCVLLVNSGPNPKSFEFGDRLECPRSESSAVRSLQQWRRTRYCPPRPACVSKCSLTQAFRLVQVQLCMVQGDWKSWRFSSGENRQIRGFFFTALDSPLLKHPVPMLGARFLKTSASWEAPK